VKQASASRRAAAGTTSPVQVTTRPPRIGSFTSLLTPPPSPRAHFTPYLPFSHTTQYTPVPASSIIIQVFSSPRH
jgi:hypothetical protein